MSTLATASYDSSSDAEDGDFVPDIPKKSTLKRKSQPKSKSSSSSKSARPPASAAKITGSGEGDAAEEAGESSAESSDSDSDDESDDEQDGDGEEEENAKRRKMEVEEERRKAAREAFAAFADGDVDGESLKGGKIEAGQAGSGSQKNVEMVDVRRPRQFAGETIYETVRLPADHADAIAFLAAQQKQNELSTLISSSTTTAPAEGEPVSSGTPQSIPAELSSERDTTAAAPSLAVPSSGVAAESGTAPTSTKPSTSIPKSGPPVASIPPKRAPPKRKPRQSLEAMSAALDKGKKMTTLEKSQMDWQSHLSTTQGLSDELASNRKSGGYLEKRDFLDRVEDRRAGAYEQQIKGAGRR